MSADLIDRLAREHLANIDHGLKKPRPGDFTIMKNLQKDLLKEQDEAHGGDREEMGEKWASMPAVQLPDHYAVDRLFGTSDLYMDMVEADDEVTVERFNMAHAETSLKRLSGDVTEHFYSALMVYHVDVARHLEGRGTSRDKGEEAAQSLHNAVPQFDEYIDIHGPQMLLGKWLPGSPKHDEYALEWELISVKNVALGMLDLEIKISERWVDAE